MIKKYEKRYNELIFDLKIAGNTNLQIIKHLGITKKTFYNWINTHNPLKQLYNEACTAGIKAKQALIKRAVGFEYTEIQKEYERRYIEEKGKFEKVLVKEKALTKYYPPDVTAIKYLLQNISTFDKELEHKILIDKEKLDIDKFNKFLENQEEEVIKILEQYYANKVKDYKKYKEEHTK